jgi:trehalose/maltose hydrolase-like predicted phosphorylase
MTDLAYWRWVYDGWDGNLEGRRETLCTLGNGYFATRGAASETGADGIHYPGTYIAGVYNRLRAEVGERTVENESIVNAPNWLPLSFRCEGGPWFGADGTEVLSHHQELDLYHGVLLRQTLWKDPQGRVTQVTQRRFVSIRDPHVGGIQTTVVAENWDGRLEVRSALDGTVINDNVARYRGLGNAHLAPLDGGGDDSEVIWLEVETNQSHIRIATSARTRLFRDGHQLLITHNQSRHDGYVEQRAAVDVTRGDEIIVEKIAALFTSRDMAINEPLWEAREWVSNVATCFDDLAARHALAWTQLWHRSRIRLGADHGITTLVNLETFHILQTVSENTIGLDAGIPARGLHGEAYRGHVFWDELFVFPFLCLRLPELARSLLLYRYRRMDQARRAARGEGFAGAMFPWQSGSNGREETQAMHLNPLSGRWRPDPSRLQRHSNAAIVVSVWQYYQATGDLQFLRYYGAEMIFEIARFWSRLATHDPDRDRYEIKGVMGPDEYHEGYPGRAQPGVDNNAYTNLMAVWCLCRAFDVLGILPPAFAAEITERLGINSNELDRWDQVSRKMRVCFHDGVISQFEGYDLLGELDWEGYRNKYGDISRLDRILEAEEDSPNRYKLSKQADVIMLFYLLPAEELAELLQRLGYQYDKELIHRNFEYYAPRTAHGSTLSRVVLAWVAARRDREASWEFFRQALYSDVREDTTAEGIHLGAMAGTLDLLQRCYTGLEFGHDILRFNPVIPRELGSLAFDIRYRDRLLHLHFTPEQSRIEVDLAEGAPVAVDVGGTRATLAPGQTLEVDTSLPHEIGVE